MKIKITEFAERHFDKDFGGTKILNMTKEEVEQILNEQITDLRFNIDRSSKDLQYKVMEGYASFCKLVVVKNFTDARVGSMPITLENYQYLRSGYSARRKNELPMFSRWLELPLDNPKAEYLVFILYSKEQIDKEAKINYRKTPSNRKYVKFDADWGVVAILGQSHSNEEPMKPETMLRNALGVEEGGSGVPLDKKEYLKSVDFWSKNATLK